MARSLTIRNIYDKKFKTIPLTGVWEKTMGNPEHNGIMLIYGPEKNGKTWFALMLAECLSQFDRILYVSGEEGAGKAFRDTMQRIGIESSNRKIAVDEYIPIEDLRVKLSKRKSQRVVFLDNLTIYSDELKNGLLRKIVSENEDKLFVLIAHEERNEPYTAVAKLASKYAQVIVRVRGLSCQISGRCPGGILTIDEQKAALCFGQEINQ